MQSHKVASCALLLVLVIHGFIIAHLVMKLIATKVLNILSMKLCQSTLVSQ